MKIWKITMKPEGIVWWYERFHERQQLGLTRLEYCEKFGISADAYATMSYRINFKIRSNTAMYDRLIELTELFKSSKLEATPFCKKHSVSYNIFGAMRRHLRCLEVLRKHFSDFDSRPKLLGKNKRYKVQPDISPKAMTPDERLRVEFSKIAQSPFVPPVGISEDEPVTHPEIHNPIRGLFEKAVEDFSFISVNPKAEVAENPEEPISPIKFTLPENGEFKYIPWTNQAVGITVKESPPAELCKKQNDIEIVVSKGVKVMISPEVVSLDIIKIIELLKDL